MLESGDVLETVAGHHSVVVVRSHQEDSGVLAVLPLLDVVQRGDSPQVGEVLLVVAAAVVGDPGVAHGELVESEEVHHTEILTEIRLEISRPDHRSDIER